MNSRYGNCKCSHTGYLGGNVMAITRGGLLEKFGDIYGEFHPEDVKTYFAPGQVNFIGDHTDYNGGHMLPCALTLGTYVAIRKRDDYTINAYSSKFPDDGIRSFSLLKQRPNELGDWLNYPMGSVWSLIAHGAKPERGFDIYYYGDLSVSSGLGSSSSIIIATIFSILDLFGIKDVPPVDMALYGQNVENYFMEIKSGILAPFISALGRKDNAVYISSAGLHSKYTPVDLSGGHIVITNSKVKHPNIKKLLDTRQKECNKGFESLAGSLNIKLLCDLTCEQFERYKPIIPDPLIQKRVKHVVYENQRTIQAFNALKTNDLDTFGKLMNESHISLRDDYEVSCPEIDTLVEAAWNTPGVIGCRLTGIGFGGCTVSLVKKHAVPEFKEKVGSIYKERTGLDAGFIVADIGDGAHEITE